MARERPAEQRIVAEVLRDHRGIGAEIEQAPHALDDEQQGARIGEADLQRERRAVREARYVDDAVLPSTAIVRR